MAFSVPRKQLNHSIERLMTNDEMIAALEATGDFRVLRKVSPRRVITSPDGKAVKKALFVDVETTGLSPEKDEIIELAMVPFTYGAEGRIFEVSEPFQGFQEPSGPITSEITKITGIDQSIMRSSRASSPAPTSS